jgi:CDP-glycerol glycerophosphotransferase
MKRMEMIKNALMSFTMFFISYFVPKSRSKIVLGSSIGIKFNGNPKYLFIRLSKDKKYTKFSPIWLTKSEKVFEKLKKFNLNVEKIGTFNSLIQLLRAKYIVIDNTPEDVFIWPFLFGRFNVINTWHGVPIKKIGKDYQTPREETGKLRAIYNIFNKIFGFNSKHHEIMIANSEMDLVNMNSAFSPKKIFLTGYPRNDVFFNRKYFEV